MFRTDHPHGDSEESSKGSIQAEQSILLALCVLTFYLEGDIILITCGQSILFPWQMITSVVVTTEGLNTKETKQDILVVQINYCTNCVAEENRADLE